MMIMTIQPPLSVNADQVFALQAKLQHTVCVAVRGALTRKVPLLNVSASVSEYIATFSALPQVTS